VADDGLPICPFDWARQRNKCDLFVVRNQKVTANERSTQNEKMNSIHSFRPPAFPDFDNLSRLRKKKAGQALNLHRPLKPDRLISVVGAGFPCPKSALRVSKCTAPHWSILSNNAAGIQANM
jgi:hypothetical protein